MRTVVDIDGETFIFADADEVVRVRHDLREAARSGADFVRMGDESRIEVLVTSSTRVRIHEVPDLEPDDDGPIDPFDELIADFDIG